MIGFEVVLAFAWTFSAANGYLIDRQLAGVEALPVAWLAPVAERANIVFHAREGLAMAFYLPGRAGDAQPAEAAGPRLALYAPYYLAPGGLPQASRMPVDVAEYYFHALIEAVLSLELVGDAAYATWLGERAAKLMAEAPEAQRTAAYTVALADFGAHLLSMRNEISRLAERQAAAGRDVCRHLDQPASLFGLWRRSLVGGRYAGGYFASGGEGPPRWTQSRRALERTDKDRFLAELFGVAWSGDPREDFKALCPNP